jgi:uncharacterized membrane protein
MFWKAFLLSLLLLPIIDAPYLYLNKDLYLAITKSISGRGFTSRYHSALLVYIALALGIAVLAVPNIRTASWDTLVIDSIKWGGVFGIAAYATFDFTMHFMFNDWTLGVAIMDTIWGGVLCSLVAGCIAYILNISQ